LILLKQIGKGQNRGLIEDWVADQDYPSEAAHGEQLEQSLFHTWFAQAVPLVHQIK